MRRFKCWPGTSLASSPACGRWPSAVGKVLDAERKAGRLPISCIPLNLALSAWTASDAYLEAVAAGGPRFNLAGEVEGDVTPEQLAHAARKLKRRRDAATQRHEQASDAVARADCRAG
jgi:sRNA-binding protein